MSGTVHKLGLDRRSNGQDDAYSEMLERAHALVPPNTQWPMLDL